MVVVDPASVTVVGLRVMVGPRSVVVAGIVVYGQSTLYVVGVPSMVVVRGTGLTG